MLVSHSILYVGYFYCVKDYLCGDYKLCLANSCSNLGDRRDDMPATSSLGLFVCVVSFWCTEEEMNGRKDEKPLSCVLDLIL